MHMNLGRWTEETLDRLLQEATGMPDASARIAFLSGRFLGLPYQANTLIGADDRPEEFVLNLAAVDCFTLFDYVEAMRRARSFPDFVAALKLVRYQGGRVSYRTRNHFFTDWLEYNSGFVRDVTSVVGGGAVRVARKTLNQREDGTAYLAGIPQTQRDIPCIPAERMTEGVVARLRTGDYLGVCARDAGLDVTHVGIVIRGEDVFLRHASSDAETMRVVDCRLQDYLSGKPGIIVLRPAA